MILWLVVGLLLGAAGGVLFGAWVERSEARRRPPFYDDDRWDGDWSLDEDPDRRP